MERLDDHRLLEVGDKLSFRIAEEPDPAVGLLVTSSGEIEVPMAGRVPARGQTCKAVAMVIKKELEKTFYNNATVILALDAETTTPLGSYFVTGQVRYQGKQEIGRNDNVTVAQAILRAGGFADFANRRKVRIIRPHPDGSSEQFVIDVKAILEKGQVKNDMLLKPGDYVVVPERWINF